MLLVTGASLKIKKSRDRDEGRDRVLRDGREGGKMEEIKIKNVGCTELNSRHFRCLQKL